MVNNQCLMYLEKPRIKHDVLQCIIEISAKTEIDKDYREEKTKLYIQIVQYEKVMEYIPILDREEKLGSIDPRSVIDMITTDFKISPLKN